MGNRSDVRCVLFALLRGMSRPFIPKIVPNDRGTVPGTACDERLGTTAQPIPTVTCGVFTPTIRLEGGRAVCIFVSISQSHILSCSSVMDNLDHLKASNDDQPSATIRYSVLQVTERLNNTSVAPSDYVHV